MMSRLVGSGVSAREMFAATIEDAPPITISALARSLNVPVSRLVPLARHGYLTLRSEGDIGGDSYVDALPAAAIVWLRGWFMPARSRPLFSLVEVAELMSLPARKVITLAAQHDIPITFDEALGGHLFSMWATKRMLMIQSGKTGVDSANSRFDRQALLWRIMEGDPQRAVRLPKFSEQLEEEIARVAAMEEPMRGIRLRKLMDQFRDARRLSESANNQSMSEELADGLDRIERLAG